MLEQILVALQSLIVAVEANTAAVTGAAPEVAEPGKPSRGRGRPPKGANTPAEPASSPHTADVPQPAAPAEKAENSAPSRPAEPVNTPQAQPASAGENSITPEVIKAKCMDVARAKGSAESVHAAIQSLGVKLVSELPPAKYPELMAKLEALLAPAAPADEF